MRGEVQDDVTPVVTYSSYHLLVLGANRAREQSKTYQRSGAAKLRHWKLCKSIFGCSPTLAIPIMRSTNATVKRQSVKNETTFQKPNARQDTNVKSLKICVDLVSGL